MNIESRR